MKHLVLFLFVGLISISANSTSLNDTILQQIQSGIKIPLTKEPGYYIKLGFNGQLEARYMQLNPGTLDYQGKPVTNDADILLRRGSFTSLIFIDRFTFFSHIAVTAQPSSSSINSGSQKTVKFYFYDLWGSYQVFPRKLIIGGGLNMYNGLSRYNSASSMKTLGVDVSMLSSPNLLTTAQSDRQLSLFFTGNLNMVSYRFAIANPFYCNTIPETIEAGKIYHQPNRHFSYKGYVELQFFDKESNIMPFKAATYIGQKKIFNVGGGFDIHPKSMVSYDINLESTNYHKTFFAVDLFLDYPFVNRSAFTLYAANFWYNFGPNYLESYGVGDIYNNGISEYQYGTGKAALIQLAYLLPASYNVKRVQPYSEFIYRNFEGLSKKLYDYHIGVNYFVLEHHLKFTIEYQNRPYIGENKTERKSLVIGKMQFSI